MNRRDDEDRPEFDPPRVSRQQRLLAEEMAPDLRTDWRFEKRNQNQDLHNALLQHPRIQGEISIKMTRGCFEDRDYYIVLCTKELPEARNACITMNRLGEELNLEGRIERIRPGQRVEDKTEEGQVIVYHFHAFYPSPISA